MDRSDIDNGREMAADGFSYEYFVNATRFLATAIRGHTKKSNGGLVHLPFDPPPRPQDRQTVVLNAERDRVVRWREGRENYDPKTGSPAGELSATERRDREIEYRELLLGITFGSRPGRYDGLSWKQNDESGWIDLEIGIFGRLIGADILTMAIVEHLGVATASQEPP